MYANAQTATPLRYIVAPQESENFLICTGRHIEATPKDNNNIEVSSWESEATPDIQDFFKHSQAHNKQLQSSDALRYVRMNSQAVRLLSVGNICHQETHLAVIY